MLLKDRYRILDTLGRGGFGETYLVEDQDLPSKRKCVLKQLSPIVKESQISSWMKERFQREAAMLEELGEKHQQIPRLYAYFAEQEKFYLVQEWIEGETLAEKHQAEGNLESWQVQKILVQLLPVLDYLHQRRIVHRDLKPENIIIRSSDRLPVLIDFGAVKEAMSTKANHDRSSSLSISIGTPGYMSSEQAAGRPVYSSDLYSLGLTAIFLLTGKSPQDLETDPQTGEIIWQKYATNITPKLAFVLDKATRFHPRDRYSSAAAMLSALQNAQESHPTIPVAPAGSQNDSYSYVGTVGYEYQDEQSTRGENKLLKIGIFLVALVGLGIGTFTFGFTLIANLLPSLQQSSSQAKVESDSERRPSLFPPLTKEEPETEADSSVELEDSEATEAEERASIIAKITKKRKEQTAAKPKTPEVVIQNSPAASPTTNNDQPIVTTGISEAQLVTTLGKPTAEKTDHRDNSKVLEYRDTATDQVNLRYKANNSGKIYYTDVILDSSVSLGEMQTTLSQLLAGNNSAAVKGKLRAVYNRAVAFSFFRAGNLEGKIERDSKDRITISVWESN